MSGLSQYQNVFRIAKPDAANNGTQSRVTKRNRQPVSCVACRTRKLKCDRQTPCMPCSKRGDAPPCNYANSRRNGRNGLDESSRTSEAQLRLQQLEEMVTSLMQNTTNSSENRTEKTSPQGANVDELLKDLSVQSSPQTSETSSGGHLDIHGSETSYLGATHWQAILGNIRDIQVFLEPGTDDSEEVPPQALPDGPDLIFGATTQSLTLADACNSLPPRPVVDTFLSVYFNAKYLQTPIIHTGKFLREYESFWADPSSVSFLWISMLFSTLWIGSQISRQSDGQVFDSLDVPARPVFLTRAGQALVSGGYNKARPYSVEAVLLYGQCKYLQREDPDADPWMIMGISTRLAMRMGYHRDPRHFANISPFEGEMRRRTFYIVTTFDLLLSFQAGLPAIIHEEECDTEPPSNLFDSDFDENCKVLPPSRPPTDPTPMLYYCYKGRFAKIFKRVFRHALSLKKPSYEDTMKLDAEIHEMHAGVPPSLQMRPLGSLLSEQIHMVLSRLNIDLVYQKCLCVLHRIYLSHDRSNPAFSYSRKTCTDAALQILNHQAELHFASQPGARFYKDRWMLSSIALHDFLLAAMVICLDLYESHNKSPATSADDLGAQFKKYDALRLSHEIWTLRRAYSRDARRASNVLAVMLSKVPRPNLAATPVIAAREPSGVSQTSVNGGNLVGSTGNSPENWNITAFNGPDQEFLVDNYAALDFNATDPLNTIFNESDDIDWGLVDQYLLDPLDWQLLDPSGLPNTT